MISLPVEKPQTTYNLICSDALTALQKIGTESIDFIMTSPPYWSKREYSHGGIGLEGTYQEYIDNLLKIFYQVKRVLKPTGSFWLNIGDTYHIKNLCCIPHRVAIRMTDEQGWILRNSIVWNKLKGGMDNSKDRLGNIYEQLFHFVKNKKDYYYNSDAIRSKPRKAKVINGSVVSATGVSGVRYRRQIELSTALTLKEKKGAYAALQEILDSVASGRISDFRMIIRSQQRTTHSNSEKISGRAKELKEKGYYFLKYHPKGSKPSDVWDILPEDTQKRNDHSAPYPVEICLIPLKATCPPKGLVLDPFCGTGTTLIAASLLGYSSIGIDISPEYIQQATERLRKLSE